MNKFLAKQRNRKGFTIIELVVVIIVIGILFVAFISKTDNTTDKAKEVGVKSIFRSYQTAAETVMREQSGLKDMTVKEIVDELNRNLDKPLQIRYVEEKHDHLIVETDEVETVKPSDGYEKSGDGAGKHAATNISCLIDYEDEWNKPYRVVISPANNFIAFYSDGANAVGETAYSKFGYDWTKDMAVTMDYTAGAVGSDAVLINPAVGYNSVSTDVDDNASGNFKDWGVDMTDDDAKIGGGVDYTADEKITTEAATNKDDYMVLIGYNQGVTLTTTEGFSTNQDASNGIVGTP